MFKFGGEWQQTIFFQNFLEGGKWQRGKMTKGENDKGGKMADGITVIKQITKIFVYIIN